MDYILNRTQINYILSNNSLLREQQEEIKNPKSCDKFKGNDKKLCKKLSNSSYRHITTPIISNILDIKKRKWNEAVPKEEQDKIFNVLLKLKDSEPGKIWRWANTNKNNKRPEQGTIDEFMMTRLPELSFVYTDGEWDPINKLDTNYSDTAVLITDIILKRYGKDFVEEILNSLISGDTSKLKEVIQDIDNNKEELFNEIETNKLKYVSNSLYNTYQGEMIEQFVEKFMETKGFKLIHRGGGGDPLDVLMGIDLIMEKDGKIYTLQAKKVHQIEFIPSTLMNPKTGAYKILANKNLYVSKQPNLDYVGYGTEDGSILVAEKQFDIKKTDDGKDFIYIDKKVFGQPKKEGGYNSYDKGSILFFVDSEFVKYKTDDL
jgi:Holliday junction resolvase-like predicted endonuclease